MARKTFTQTNAMIITEIRVTAARTFNHPTERFANFRHEFTATAKLEPDDIPQFAEKKLRRQVEEIAENHKADILHDLRLETERDAAEWNLKRAKGWEGTVAEYTESLEVLTADLAKTNDPVITDDEWSRLSHQYGCNGWVAPNYKPLIGKKITETKERLEADIAKLKAEGLFQP